MASCSIVWFRKDLRIGDNAALAAAISAGGCVVPVYVWDPESEGAWAPGAASKWWLRRSLEALDADLRKAGSRLIVRKGTCSEELRALVNETGAQRVFANRRYEPEFVRNERAACAAAGVQIQTENSALLIEPWHAMNRQGRPYQVFTPFWRGQFGGFGPEAPIAKPRRIPAPTQWPTSVAIDELAFGSDASATEGMRAEWQPGERGAAKALDDFLEQALDAYPDERDRPDLRGTSRLSPHLHFGEIGPRTIWRAVVERAEFEGARGLVKAQESFLRQLVWREFAYHLLVNFPHTPDSPLRTEFATFPWKEDRGRLDAWKCGRTGYPLVDAGMRELLATGWMHNRVRMAAASFLVKHLLVPWQSGAKWFWDRLVDADLANNTFGWQWTAGCGADAAPYFRVFNPVLQGQKFDPDGAYVRRWVPELSTLPARWIHRPWEAPLTVLKEAGVTPGKEYPRPIVDPRLGRERALAAYSEFRSRAR